MPRRNRVDPFGRLIATDARGTLFGNRGRLHDDRQQIVRNHSSERRWISCLTEFKGRRRELMLPGRYTEIFFLDEATALAAGHRPCAECRRERFNEFRAAWAVGQGVNPASVRVGPLDRVLHSERLSDDGGKRTYEARLGTCPTAPWSRWNRIAPTSCATVRSTGGDQADTAQLGPRIRAGKSTC